ncbi:replication protein [Cronobacter malonaticus]|uniref:replication protein n=1 Tax=Cronobacter malonaticus TaxID=413503 RepID=UPI0024AECF97|nr:replication protein [Cronobacter malonaticus]MDI7690172.1 replication protein [Cronobacter malonaticus]MDK1298105.1 replication protein [Cronobacter malonaticus]
MADLDNGFTRIANELLEAVIVADLTARQLKVVLAVMRKTYGFGRALDRISNVQIAEETGIHHTHICKAKNELIAMNILVSSGNQIGINKVVSDWNTGISQNSKTLAKTANTSLAKSANTTHHERLANSANKTLANPAKHKRNKNKIYITPLTPQGGKAKFNPLEVDLPDWLDPAVWREWVQYRTESKKPIKSMLTVTKAIKLLSQYRDAGDNPAEVVNQSIANGWQGLFRVKAPGRGVAPINAGHVPHWNSPEAWEDVF